METTTIVPSWTTGVIALSAGLLVARLAVGLYMAAHGAQKLFGWFGGPGFAGTAGLFEQLGFRPARLFAAVAAGAEVISGLLTALGLLGPVGPALMVSVMIVAIGSVHRPHGFFAMNNGIEVPLLYAAGAVALALAGPGGFSADALFGLEGLWTPRVAWAVLLVGIAGGAANLAIRRPAPQPAPEW
ncbi:MAG TPA: DoxX family protein [Longimicrobiales bacterium]